MNGIQKLDELLARIYCDVDRKVAIARMSISLAAFGARLGIKWTCCR